MKRKKKKKKSQRRHVEYSYDYDDKFPPYVSNAERRARAARGAKKLAKHSDDGLEPVTTTARSIATTFWGQAWNKNLELYSDYESRLPRGRTYLRSGCVLDLKIKGGRVEAKVQGQELYDVVVKVAELDKESWDAICNKCSGNIASMFDLLAGKLDASVMKIVTRPADGLFPAQSEIKLSCTCPDWADMCKHIAAVMYGISVRLDEQPELLFKLRGVDHREMVTSAAVDDLDKESGDLEGANLSELFNIDLD